MLVEDLLWKRHDQNYPAAGDATDGDSLCRLGFGKIPSGCKHAIWNVDTVPSVRRRLLSAKKEIVQGKTGNECRDGSGRITDR
jgi:hypothetical protein